MRTHHQHGILLDVRPYLLDAIRPLPNPCPRFGDVAPNRLPDPHQVAATIESAGIREWSETLSDVDLAWFIQEVGTHLADYREFDECEFDVVTHLWNVAGEFNAD